ncbi:TRAP transporter large permease [Natribacillus halophilus]|uniref:TRAP transporter, DctM subunit n=1 Tax=Natribacillus halophilus TaxID=549003 RepID=A0A1G8PB17_9BACI|nr:TRAP transporter large permease [Natribacillus halophilus]SDI89662.1 TRAP transporter, DctM subunit [Natribacillus halophilus]
MLEIGIFVIVLLFILLIIGVPVAFSMILSGTLGLVIGTSGLEIISTIPQRIYSGLVSFQLLAIPFFIMTGIVMNKSGITDILFKFVEYIIGRFRGGMGNACVLTSVVFGGMSGSAVADASGLGLIQTRVMERVGYDRGFAAAVTASSSIVAPIIPPSIPLIIYGSMTGISITQLFIGGIVPGLLIGISMFIVVYITARVRNYRTSTLPNLQQFFRTGMKSLPGLLTPVILIGGILSGVFTATETAIVAAAYSLFIGFVVYRTLNLKKFLEAMNETFLFTVKVMFIVGAADLFGWVLTYFGVTNAFTDLLLNVTDSAIGILLILCLMYLILGTFMESIAILVLTVPIVMPIVQQAGIDPLFFGIIVTVVLSIGLITPPVGMVLFPISDITRIPIMSLAKQCIPFYAALLLVFIALLWQPEIVMFLPELFR